jgi:hypothetical protein
MDKVEVYFNLHKKCFSVRKNGLVIRHCNRITLKNSTFKVSQAGRERVLKEKKKNVHAFVVGSPIGKISDGQYDVNEVSYNPYKQGYFVRKTNKEAVYSAEFVRLVVLNRKAHIFILEKKDEVSNSLLILRE